MLKTKCPTLSTICTLIINWMKASTFWILGPCLVTEQTGYTRSHLCLHLSHTPHRNVGVSGHQVTPASGHGEMASWGLIRQRNHNHNARVGHSWSQLYEHLFSLFSSLFCCTFHNSLTPEVAALCLQSAYNDLQTRCQPPPASPASLTRH